jgi:hypothetical protein
VLVLEMFLPTVLGDDPASYKGTWTGVGTGDIPPYLGG